MKINDSAIIYGKITEALIGIFLLIPPIMGVIFFVINVFDFGGDGKVPELNHLSESWTTRYGYDKGGGGGMSAAPVYLGLMSIAGAYLIKDSLKYLFTDDK